MSFDNTNPCFQKAKQIVEHFVRGSWNTLWEDMIARSNLRGGCVLDALELKCHSSIRSAICRKAAADIRARHPNLSSEKRCWEGKKALWSDKEINEIVEIVVTAAKTYNVHGLKSEDSCNLKTEIEKVKKSHKITNINLQTEISDRAMSVAREFTKLSYDSADWEKLIGKLDLKPHGCLIHAISLKCPKELWEQATLDGALALRKRYPEFTSGRNAKKAWKEKTWDDESIVEIVSTVKDAVKNSVIKYSNYVDDSVDITLLEDSKLDQNGLFTPWCFFRERKEVSQLPGVYLIAYFEETPPAEVDPISKNIIYIGIAKDQSLQQRLSQFEKTALIGTGHSGGFSYRTLFVPEVFDNNVKLLKRFHNTLCSWREVSSSNPETPREIEITLLKEYRNKWGALPLLNKQG